MAKDELMPMKDLQEKATAIAHPNIALAKYWGKQDTKHNLPVVPSLSVTLAGMKTTTTVGFDSSLAQDELVLDGAAVPVAQVDRVTQLLDLVSSTDRPRARVVSANDFPTASGLASSAAAFAALAVAANAAAGAGRSAAELSDVARRVSASAGRSVFGGYVELPAATAETLFLPSIPRFAAEHWDLRLVVAVTTEQRKAVGSTVGMIRTAGTSPLYPAWVRSAPAMFERVFEAVSQRSLSGLGAAAEQSALTMHAVAMAADPALLYWNATTLRVIHEVRRWRQEGLEAYFTIDAGPHVKVITSLPELPEVQRRLADVPGVLRLIDAHPGGAARLLTPAPIAGESA